MTWFLFLCRFILRLGLMKNLIKQKISSRVCFDFIWSEHVLRVTEERRFVVFVDVDDTKSYEVHSAHCRFTRNVASMEERGEADKRCWWNALAATIWGSLWGFVMKWQGGVQILTSLQVFSTTAVRESLGSKSKFASKADTLNSRPRFTPCRLPLSWIEINFKRVSESSVRVI